MAPNDSPHATAAADQRIATAVFLIRFTLYQRRLAPRSCHHLRARLPFRLRRALEPSPRHPRLYRPMPVPPTEQPKAACKDTQSFSALSPPTGCYVTVLTYPNHPPPRQCGETTDVTQHAACQEQRSMQVFRSRAMFTEGRRFLSPLPITGRRINAPGSNPKPARSRDDHDEASSHTGRAMRPSATVHSRSEAAGPRVRGKEPSTGTDCKAKEFRSP